MSARGKPISLSAINVSGWGHCFFRKTVKRANEQ